MLVNRLKATGMLLLYAPVQPLVQAITIVDNNGANPLNDTQHVHRMHVPFQYLVPAGKDGSDTAWPETRGTIPYSLPICCSLQDI